MAVTAWLLIKRLFFETKTPIPASVACVRVFSAVGDIFTPMRARTDYTNFENQLLLKLNKDYVK
jgi:hypothetical protein